MIHLSRMSSDLHPSGLDIIFMYIYSVLSGLFSSPCLCMVLHVIMNREVGENLDATEDREPEDNG